MIEKYKFFSSLILRTPAYSLEEYKSKTCKELLKKDDFLTALFHSSNVFHAELQKKINNPDRLSEDEWRTLKKYWNRGAH